MARRSPRSAAGVGGGITFSCREKSEPRGAVCYSGRDRCYLFIPKQARISLNSLPVPPPPPTLALFRSDVAHTTHASPLSTPPPIFSPLLSRYSSLARYLCLYLSIYLSASRVSLFPSTCLTFEGRRPYLSVPAAPRSLARRASPFYKIDRVDETEETRSGMDEEEEEEEEVA